jgi:hypothetical protein
MSSPPVGRVKRGLLQFAQSLAMAVFVGVAVYGVMAYWGGETREVIPPGTSILLGLLAVICVGVIVCIGGIQDRIAHRDDQQDNSEQDME